MTKKRLPRVDEVEKVHQVSNQPLFQQLVGELDSNLKIIEKRLGVKIRRSSQGLSIKGSACEVELVCELLRQVGALLSDGEQLFPGDLERAITMLAGNSRVQLSQLFRDQIKIAGRQHHITPKTINQKLYLDAIRGCDLVFGVGPAGTGKTYLAMAMAVAALLRRQVKRIILCRPAVEAGEKLGFLPGDMAEKVNPYLRPLYDALHDMVDYERAKEMVDRGVIEVAPLAFMRGRTLSDAFVILDEAQNTTPVQMKMFLTRLGVGAKCVVTGDVSQIDLPPGAVSGLQDALRALADIEAVEVVRFTEVDVIRHPLVTDIVAAYQRREEKGL